MEEETLQTRETTKTTFRAQPVMGMGVRLVFSIGLAVFGVWGLLNALIVALSMVAILGAFLYGFVSIPFLSLATFATFLVSCAAFGVVGIVALKWAYYLVRKRDFARREVTILIVCLVLALVLTYGVAPVLQNALPV